MAAAAEDKERRASDAGGASGSAKKKKKKSKFWGEIFIDRERCKGCGFCVEFCPTEVLALDQAFNRKGYHPPVVVDLEACNGCDLCGLYCPDFAIHGVRHRTKEAG
jgi:2-oxoglutarate ferredoxin oxidoreductase subunit delta